ncbi:IQ calmodulin-binding motif protein [Niveomyces insectorum RCEF 264]|uniref:IQ calmodulin-binding motif protein n=1 Tax=Niveomyces insectorum RCEF 264 TaxID=1081102 RepID=A0A167WG65_9HYPO|nr:IQ calmodulin-binding motif protein [Niveomyces insectorum RCEF 264]
MGDTTQAQPTAPPADSPATCTTTARPKPSTPSSSAPLSATLSTAAAKRQQQYVHSQHSVASQPSTDTKHSSQTHKEYIDSLLMPSKDELVRIAGIQEDREAEQRRRSRELRQQQRQRQQQRESDSDSSSKSASDTPRSSNPHMSTLAPKERGSGPDGSGQDDASAEGASGTRVPGPVSRPASPDCLARSRAATIIQRHYRGYRVRREMHGLGISAKTRWVHAIREAQYRELTRPKAPADEDEEDSMRPQPALQEQRLDSNAQRKWRKAVGILKRAGLDQDSESDTTSDSETGSDYGADPRFDSDAEHSSSSTASSRRRKKETPEQKQQERERRATAKARRRKDARMMDLQYFLEMIDVKHRYGSNLRTYHEEWKRSNTMENFFYWLDYGEGRSVDMAACPREQLDREQVRYLSREERQYYLVKIDREGRLCWAKNGMRIDTSAKWKDSVHGIVPADDPTPAFAPTTSTAVVGTTNEHTRSHAGKAGAMPTDNSESESDVGDAKPSDGRDDSAASVKRIRHYSASTVFNALLRKSVQKNTWIFVADTNFRLYVGIKVSGAFQHSSFLQGSRISAAGLIKIRNGRLTSLSPLSGHYRPPTSSFRAFVQSLRDAGVDMSHVSISKSYAVLVGLEAYTKTRQRGKSLLQHLSLHHHQHHTNKEDDDKKADLEISPYDMSCSSNTKNTSTNADAADPAYVQKDEHRKEDATNHDHDERPAKKLI